MHRNYLPVIVTTLLTFLSWTSYCEKPFVAVGMTEKAPVIDGILDDECWNRCIGISNFIKYGDTGNIAGEDTKVYLTYDSENIYIAFKCLESRLDEVLNQRHLFKREMKNDKKDTLKVFKDDCVEIFLSCEKEISNEYYHICVNSLGTVYDSIGPSAPDKWNSSAVAAGILGKKEWFLEIAIPLEKLSKDKIIPGKSVWLANFCRNSKPAKETSSWNWATAGFHAPEIFGELRFVENTPGIKDFRFSEFKAGNNFLYADIYNPSDKSKEYTLGLESIFNSSEQVNSTEIELIKAKNKKQFKLKYTADTANMCIKCNFNKPEDPTVTLLRSENLGLKPDTDYIFKADIKSNYTLSNGKPYHFLYFKSKDYKAVPGSDFPLKSNGWIRIKNNFRTGKEKKDIELWLIKWARRGIKGEIHVDNIEIIEKSTGKNLLRNGNFQNGPSGWSTCQPLNKSYGSASEKMEYCYFVRNNNQALYRSPFYNRKLLMENPDINSQFVNFGFRGAYKVDDLFLAAGAPERINLVLKSNKADNADKAFFEIKMPHICRLRFPSVPSGEIEPLKVEEYIETEGNEKIRRYVMEFDNKSLSFSDVDPWRYVVIPLVFESIGWKTDKRSGTILYKAWLDEKLKEDNYHELKLGILPPLAGKQPKSLPLIIWAYPALMDFCLLGRDVQDAFIRKMAYSGYNLAVINREQIKRYKNHGINGFAMLPNITIAAGFPNVRQFIKEHPEYAAKYPDGKTAEAAVDPAYILQKDCLFHNTMKNVFSRYIEFFPYSLDWDYEFPFMEKGRRRAKIGFSERNLKLFKTHAKIPENETLNADIIYSKYSEEWLDFRCKQNSEIAGIYNKLIKEVKKDCIFSLYSAYPPHGDSHCGIKWKYASEYIDLPICGYGGNNEIMMKTIKQKYFNAGLLIMSYVDQRPIENTLANLLTSAGSYMSYIHFVLDGRFFYASSRVAAVAADFEEFFLNLKGNIHNELAYGMDDKPRKDVKIITNGKKRLVIFFNNSSEKKKIKIKNKSLPEDFIGIDCGTKQLLKEPQTIEVEITPWTTKAVYLCPAKELENDFENAPIKTFQTQTDYPILRWKDKTPFKKKYELVYGTKADLSDAKTVKNIPECYIQLPEEIIKCSKIFWKVRAIAVTEKNKSPWSKTFELSLNPETGSFVLHKKPVNDPFAKLGFWEHIAWGGGGPINILEKDYDIKKEGAYSLKCQNSFDTSCSIWTNYRRYGSSTRLPKVSVGEKYNLSAWIKTEGAEIKSCIDAGLMGENGKGIKHIKSNIVVGTSDWKKVELKFTILSEDVRTFKIMFKTDGKGTAWCCGMKLTKDVNP